MKIRPISFGICVTAVMVFSLYSSFSFMIVDWLTPEKLIGANVECSISVETKQMNCVNRSFSISAERILEQQKLNKPIVVNLFYNDVSGVWSYTEKKS